MANPMLNNIFDQDGFDCHPRRSDWNSRGVRPMSPDWLPDMDDAFRALFPSSELSIKPAFLQIREWCIKALQKKLADDRDPPAEEPGDESNPPRLDPFVNDELQQTHARIGDERRRAEQMLRDIERIMNLEISEDQQQLEFVRDALQKKLADDNDPPVEESEGLNPQRSDPVAHDELQQTIGARIGDERRRVEQMLRDIERIVNPEMPKDQQQLKVVRHLIYVNGVDVNCRDDLGRNCLHHAIQHHKYELARLLLDVGARTESSNLPRNQGQRIKMPEYNPSTISWEFRTLNPLYFCLELGDSKMAQILFEAGADRSQVEFKTAVKMDHLNVIRVSLELGLDVNTLVAYASCGSSIRTWCVMTYIQVSEAEGKEPVLELPTENDGTLRLSTISAQFPGTCGLRYRSSESKALRGLRLAYGKLYPPEDGWGKTVYFCNIPEAVDSHTRNQLDDGRCMSHDRTPPHPSHAGQFAQARKSDWVPLPDPIIILPAAQAGQTFANSTNSNLRDFQRSLSQTSQTSQDQPKRLKRKRGGRGRDIRKYTRKNYSLSSFLAL